MRLYKQLLFCRRGTAIKSLTSSDHLAFCCLIGRGSNVVIAMYVGFKATVNVNKATNTKHMENVFLGELKRVLGGMSKVSNAVLFLSKYHYLETFLWSWREEINYWMHIGACTSLH